MKIPDPSLNTLAAEWLAATKSDNSKNSECFASSLFFECRNQLSRRSLTGLMAGAEREVEQEACTMLLNSFLAGNARLQEATASGDLDAIDLHLRTSVKFCLQFAIRRIATARARENTRHVACSEIAESELGSTLHPRLRTYADLTCDERATLALAAVQLARRLRVISERNAEVTLLTLDEGLRPQEIAQQLGVSPRAIYQQLQRISTRLNSLINTIEEEVE